MAPAKSNKTLKSGRPPTAHRTPTTLSKKTTSSTIRSFHRLNKALSTAQTQGDEEAVTCLKAELAELGGLETYQRASIQGQANDRGGDSSVVLMEWLRPHLSSSKQPSDDGRAKLRMLEVGALSTTNACSRSGAFDVTRIDLNSRNDGILQQDFMDRPLPAHDGDRFDALSLSLVLNFVPDAKGRGEMLKRTTDFLRQPPDPPPVAGEVGQDVLPALFLVLPLPCVTNSRFLTDERLTLIMAGLGYALRHRKQTSKLVYYLWVLRDKAQPESFAKREVRPGGGRNNFCVVVDAT